MKNWNKNAAVLFVILALTFFTAGCRKKGAPSEQPHKESTPEVQKKEEATNRSRRSTINGEVVQEEDATTKNETKSSQNKKIPLQFVGLWQETDAQGKVINTFVITDDSITWNKGKKLIGTIRHRFRDGYLTLEQNYGDQIISSEKLKVEDGKRKVVFSLMVVNPHVAIGSAPPLLSRVHATVTFQENTLILMYGGRVGEEEAEDGWVQVLPTEKHIYEKVE